MTPEPTDPPADAALTLRFPPELPISARVEELTKAITAHQVVIVAGATGSGKSTQLPKIALSMGRGRKKLIGVTQPRRIAATSLAARVANEVGTPLGQDIGYQIRFEQRSGNKTAVKFLTDGVLLAELHNDPLLRRYDTIIVDEAHERSLNIDFLLGWIKRILPKRPDLKVIVSSATLELERFSQFFNNAPTVQVEGRTFPVDVLYAPPDKDLDLSDAVANAVADVLSLDPNGDVLVFLPGEREIREAESALLARPLRHTVVQPLYARLTAAEQARVFANIPQRRVILATNVAETSLTIPGIVYVIDTGQARLSRYDPRSGITRLQLEAISQASAEQRKGRCGRVREGVCIRLYDEANFAARSGYTDPELRRTGLAGVILRMKSLGLGDVEDFPFLDPPQSRSITEGYRVLEELGALDRSKALTPLGEQLARFPVDPRIARMILAGAQYGCLREMLVVAAALTIQDPRERPRELQQRADELHARFRDERSDFSSLLKLWEFVNDAEVKGTSQLRRACKENFLSFVRVREWKELVRQLEDIVAEQKLETKTKAPADSDALHRALVCGMLSRIGQWNPEKRSYQGARETRFVLHPSSTLAKKPPAWVMTFELVETSQLFARMVAKLDPEWLLEAGAHLVKRNHSDPHWSEKSARAVVKESATLYGLMLYRDRNVDYASVNPAQARLLFLDHALVRGEYKTKGTFQEKNQKLLEQVTKLRDKARRSTMLADDDALLSFFDRRVPETIVNGKLFETWRQSAEAKDPNVLSLSLSDVLLRDHDLVPEHYPDEITVQGVQLPLSYCFDPTAEDDGITVTIPLVLLPQIPPGVLDWTVRGWLREKLSALLNHCPKALRRDLGSIPELCARMAETLEPFDGPMIPAVVEQIEELTGVALLEEALRPDAVSPYLRLLCKVVDEDGKVLGQDRSFSALVEQFGARARAAWKSTSPAPAWERTGLTAWTFGELPLFLTRRVGGVEVRNYPALVDRGTSVDLALLEAQHVAEQATMAGVRRLFLLAIRGIVSVLQTKLPQALPRLDGAPTSRAETEAFREQLLARIADHATHLSLATIPRTRLAFEAMVRDGAVKMDPSAKKFSEVLANLSQELLKTIQALKSAAKHPSGTAARKDLQAQLEQLFPSRLLEQVPLQQLEHYPRYLRAMQVRLNRAMTDPQKDAGKHAPFAPLWNEFLAKAPTARQQHRVAELRWLFEELRVAIFAPELTVVGSVSVKVVATELSTLR